MNTYRNNPNRLKGRILNVGIAAALLVTTTLSNATVAYAAQLPESGQAQTVSYSQMSDPRLSDLKNLAQDYDNNNNNNNKGIGKQAQYKITLAELQQARGRPGQEVKPGAANPEILAAPETLEAIVSTENILINPSFTDGGAGWDLRPGRGENGGDLGVIDTSVYLSGPASLKIPYSPNVCDEKECTRAVWLKDAITIDDKADLREGDVLSFSGYVRLGAHSDDPSQFWVHPEYAGSLEGYPDADKDQYHLWVNRGGARLGLDFYNADGEIIATVMRIADWTNDADTWYRLEMCMPIVEGTKYVVPWIQAFEADAPAPIWLDDVSLSVIRFR